MIKPAVTAALFVVPLLATSIASADTTTTEADTLVVVTPNAPVVVQQGAPQQPVVAAQAPGAVAPAPAPAAANGAPQNEDWNNVSHINGVPVKVGERGDYLYDNGKHTNIAVNPFGLFFGLYDISVTHGISRNVAVSAAFTGVDNYYQLSATLPIYFRRTFSGPYLEPGLLVRSDTNSCYDCTTTMSSTWTGPQMMFGWQWTFDSGLNVQFAAGLAKRLTNTSSDSGSNTEGNGYFRVGYAF